MFFTLAQNSFDGFCLDFAQGSAFQVASADANKKWGSTSWISSESRFESRFWALFAHFRALFSSFGYFLSFLTQKYFVLKQKMTPLVDFGARALFRAVRPSLLAQREDKRRRQAWSLWFSTARNFSGRTRSFETSKSALAKVRAQLPSDFWSREQTRRAISSEHTFLFLSYVCGLSFGLKCVAPEHGK